MPGTSTSDSPDPSIDNRQSYSVATIGYRHETLPDWRHCPVHRRCPNANLRCRAESVCIHLECRDARSVPRLDATHSRGGSLPGPMLRAVRALPHAHLGCDDAPDRGTDQTRPGAAHLGHVLAAHAMG